VAVIPLRWLLYLKQETPSPAPPYTFVLNFYVTGVSCLVFFELLAWFFGKFHLVGLFKNQYSARCRWLTLVILATQEAEIRRIVVQSQFGQIVCETLS
jgi:hypothetical protein